MKIINQFYEILSEISPGGIKELKLIEKAARTCYRSENKISEDGESAKKMIKNLIAGHHEAMLEHSFLSVMFHCDRGVANELVRHRLAAYAQESTRYCNYSNDKKFDEGIGFIDPVLDKVPIENRSEAMEIFLATYNLIEDAYNSLTELGCPPEIARDVLPCATSCYITISTNYREWRHILNLRACNATGPAHPKIQKLMSSLLSELKEKLPIIFDDLEVISNDKD